MQLLKQYTKHFISICKLFYGLIKLSLISAKCGSIAPAVASRFNGIAVNNTVPANPTIAVNNTVPAKPSNSGNSKQKL